MNDLKIRSVEGRVIPVEGNDIDTDRIIPARFMKCVTFDDLGKYLFYDARFNEDGTPKDHPLNDEKFRGGTILAVRRNFGCGSSREHAPQSILRYGIRGIIGESFAEIFADNCASVGLVLAMAEEREVESLMRFIRENPSSGVVIDLVKKEVSCKTMNFPVHIPEQARKSFIEGTWDSTAELISVKSKIEAVAAKIPYNHDYR